MEHTLVHLVLLAVTAVVFFHGVGVRKSLSTRLDIAENRIMVMTKSLSQIAIRTTP